jgi:hypothetical protein
MGFKVPQHWGILGAKISIHDRAKYSQSQVEALEIHYPQNLPAQEKIYLEEILSYYTQLYGDFK